MQSQRRNCLLIYFKITSRHRTTTLPSHFFNKLGKRRRNANESTRIYQLTLTSHITRLLWEYCVSEQKQQLCPVPKEPGETLCLSCQAFAYQHSCKPQIDPKPPCFIQTLSSFPTPVGTTDPSGTSLSTAPGGLAPSHSQGQLQSRRSEMYRWQVREGDSWDLATTGQSKQTLSSSASWADCLQITYCSQSKTPGSWDNPSDMPWCPGWADIQDGYNSNNKCWCLVKSLISCKYLSEVNAKLTVLKNLCPAHFCSGQVQNFPKFWLCLQEIEGNSQRFSLHFIFQP